MTILDKINEWIIEAKTESYSQGLKDGMIANLTFIMAYLRKEKITQTEVGKTIYNYLNEEKTRIQNIKPTGE